MSFNPCENCVFNKPAHNEDDYAMCKDEEIEPKTANCFKKLQVFAWKYADLLH